MDAQLTDKLTDKQARIIQRVARGETWTSAAKAEGCRDSYARVIRTRMMKKPAVVKEIEAIRAEGRTLAGYDIAKAMEESQAVIAFAILHKAPMAYFKAVQHRAALNGLLVEEIHLKTENLDLKGALTEARGRVFSIVDIRSERGHDSLAASKVLTAAAQPAETVAADGSPLWEPLISGD